MFFAVSHEDIHIVPSCIANSHLDIFVKLNQNSKQEVFSSPVRTTACSSYSVQVEHKSLLCQFKTMRNYSILASLHILSSTPCAIDFLAAPPIDSSDALQYFRKEIILGSVLHRSENGKKIINAPIKKPRREDGSTLIGSNIHGTERRRLLHGVILSAAIKGIAAHAYSSAYFTISTEQPILSEASKSAIRDPTVESYRKGSNQIHIVGTAHISSLSAQLSRDAVKETKVNL